MGATGVVDFAADMDGSANTVVLWITAMNNWGEAKYSTKAFGDSNAWMPSVSVASAIRVGFPSVFRPDASKIVLGFGADTTDGNDGGNACSLYWDGTTMGGPHTVGLHPQTDNVFDHQI
ncbi:MAG: hypothetical protein ACUVXI_05065 [bacterium]